MARSKAVGGNGNGNENRRVTKRTRPTAGLLPPNVRRHAHVLCVLAKAKPKVVKELLSGADVSLLKAISECSYNVLQGRVKLTSEQKRRLSRYKTVLRTIVAKNTSCKRKKALAQKGGFLGALLGTVAPFILKAIGGTLFGRG